MLIGELLKRLDKQSMKEVCKEIGVNPSTVQRKLKSLGYKWDNSGKKWYWGWDKAQPLELNIVDLINKPVNPAPVNKPVNNPEPIHKPESQDLFDQLLNPKPDPNSKIQRGFYFDPKVIKALDKNVKSKYKSEFVNAALERVLKEKGLL